MNKLPTVLSFIALIIPLNRITSFVMDEVGESNQINAWAFSIMLAGIIYVASYYNKPHQEAKKRGSSDDTKIESLKSKRARKSARFTLYTFLLFDMIINTAKVWSDRTTEDIFVIVALVLYGMAPTIAIVLMGALQGHIDKLPKSRSITYIEKIKKQIENRIKSETRKVKAANARAESYRKNAETKVKTIEIEKKELEKTIASLEKQLKKFDNDWHIIVNGATKVEKIKAWNRKRPDLNQNTISKIIPCAVSQVNTTLNGKK